VYLYGIVGQDQLDNTGTRVHDEAMTAWNTPKTSDQIQDAARHDLPLADDE
jgi:hypothetical protein